MAASAPLVNRARSRVQCDVRGEDGPTNSLLARATARRPRTRRSGLAACTIGFTSAQKDLQQSGRDAHFFSSFFWAFRGFAVLSCAFVRTIAHGLGVGEGARVLRDWRAL